MALPLFIEPIAVLRLPSFRASVEPSVGVYAGQSLS